MSFLAKGDREKLQKICKIFFGGNMDTKLLIEKAIKMLSFSYTPYSHFHVGAALLTKDGKIFEGCNIENAAYGPSNCAERTAIFKAVSEGYKDFEAIAIVGGPENPETHKVELNQFCPPCGVCRQVLSEFCKKDFKIILAIDINNYKIYSLEELLPLSFSLNK